MQTRRVRRPEVSTKGSCCLWAEEKAGPGDGLLLEQRFSRPPKAAKGLTLPEMQLLRKTVGKGSRAPSPSCFQSSYGVGTSHRMIKPEGSQLSAAKAENSPHRSGRIRARWINPKQRRRGGQGLV